MPFKINTRKLENVFSNLNRTRYENTS